MQDLTFICVWIERKQSGSARILGRHSVQSLPRLWHWVWWQQLTEDTEWATCQGKIYSCNSTYYMFDYSYVSASFLIHSCTKLCSNWRAAVFCTPLFPHIHRQPTISPWQMCRHCSSSCPVDGASSLHLSQTQRQRSHPHKFTRNLSPLMVNSHEYQRSAALYSWQYSRG